MNPRERAEAAGAAMWADDRATPGLGIALDRTAPGGAALSMVVRWPLSGGDRVTCGGAVIAEFRGHSRAVAHRWVSA